MRTPPDQKSRELIERELDVNLMVDASAGSGKTESLSRRMAHGILSGRYQVDNMAAVTFTRKAASELRTRLQLVLERAVRDEDQTRSRRAHTALTSLESMFIGTIHSFCARLLREFPVEAGVSPGFKKLDQSAQQQLRVKVFQQTLETCSHQFPGLLAELSESRVRPTDLLDALATVCDNNDVDYPAQARSRPETQPVWQAMDRFAQQLTELLPEDIPKETTCGVQSAARSFMPRLKLANRERLFGLVQCLEIWDGALKVTQKYWPGKAAERKRVSAEALEHAQAFVEQTVAPFMQSWRAYLYGLTMKLLLQARKELVAERLRTAQLDFGDLLELTARVLRQNLEVRQALQSKYRWLFVDEFQDTDPIQAEVILLLSSREDYQGSDWMVAPLRAGSLFVVGDPKQSIYRFRRADIDTYEFVKKRILENGGKLAPLTTSFRSIPELCAWSNGVFSSLFPNESVPGQAAFSGLQPVRERPDGALGGVFQLTDHSSRYFEVAEHESRRLAGIIVEAVREHGYSWGDFLVLTQRKGQIAHYARALEELRVPTETTGALPEDSPWVTAIKELLAVLGDPQDTIATVGVLRGNLYGISDEELYRHKTEGGSFSLLSAAYGKGHGPVLGALEDLSLMHSWVAELPAGAAVEKILDHTGVLAMAATENPGDGHVPGLMQLADQIRLASLAGRSLAQALADIELQEQTRPVSMNSGRRDVVRVMNLHQAKGLQAPVVFLAAPTSGLPDTVSHRVVRQEGRALGYLSIENRYRVFAQPYDWQQHQALEQGFQQQERLRLLYVAATRARDLLVVSRWSGQHGSAKQPWQRFHPFLEDVPELPWGGMGAADSSSSFSVEDANEAYLERTAGWAQCRLPSWSRTSVTAHNSSKGLSRFEVPVPEEVLAGERKDVGPAWGELIHRLLEQAVRGPNRDREHLEKLARWYVYEQPELLEVVPLAVDTVLQVMQTEFWQRVMQSGERLVEVPFGVKVDKELVFGVLDLALRGEHGWELVDYKTDQKAMDQLVEQYAAQVGEYARHWSAIVDDVTYAGIFRVREGELSDDVRG